MARALPSAEAAGQLFQSLGAIGSNPVSRRPGDVALDAQDWASRAGQMPKVMKDFIRRTTDPNLGGLTYSEARQFLSNAGERLSSAEQMKLTPKATRSISQFASSWNSAIRDVAEDAGVLDHYTDAVDQYRQAMKLKQLLESNQGTRQAASGADSEVVDSGVATAYAIKSAVSR